MPQASDRLLAIPMIKPRLPRKRPEASAIDPPSPPQGGGWASYGIGYQGLQARPTGTPHGVNSRRHHANWALRAVRAWNRWRAAGVVCRGHHPRPAALADPIAGGGDG